MAGAYTAPPPGAGAMYVHPSQGHAPPIAVLGPVPTGVYDYQPPSQMGSSYGPSRVPAVQDNGKLHSSE